MKMRTARKIFDAVGSQRDGAYTRQQKRRAILRMSREKPDKWLCNWFLAYVNGGLAGAKFWAAMDEENTR